MTENVESLIKEIREKNSMKTRDKILSSQSPSGVEASEKVVKSDTQPSPDQKKTLKDLEEIALRVEGTK